MLLPRPGLYAQTAVAPASSAAPSATATASPTATATATAAPTATATAGAPADDLKQRGDQAMDAARYADALALYDQAYAASHDPAILYNVSRIHQKTGNYPAALDALERFSAQASPDMRGRVPRLEALLAELRGKVVTFDIYCNVDGARVLVRDQVIGRTPLLKPVRVAAGPQKVEILLDGYFPFERQLDAQGGQTLVIDAQLASKAVSGVVAITSPVVGAEVALDGDPRGNAPLEAILRPGMHHIRVARSGYQTVETDFVVTAGEHKDLSMPLVGNPPITTKWWFWTGVGVVIAGGVVLAYALTTTKSVTPGSISPGVVSAGLHF
jgi:hypothetical protein